MATFNTGCLFGTFKNSSGGRKRFGFLPPHGRELAADEEFTVFGDPAASVLRGHRSTDRRHIQALEDALARGDIQIVKTPAPILEAPDGSPHMLQVSNAGALSTTDPCWFNSVSA